MKKLFLILSIFILSVYALPVHAAGDTTIKFFLATDATIQEGDYFNLSMQSETGESKDIEIDAYKCSNEPEEIAVDKAKYNVLTLSYAGNNEELAGSKLAVVKTIDTTTDGDHYVTIYSGSVVDNLPAESYFIQESLTSDEVPDDTEYTPDTHSTFEENTSMEDSTSFEESTMEENTEEIKENVNNEDRGFHFVKPNPIKLIIGLIVVVMSSAIVFVVWFINKEE